MATYKIGNKITGIIRSYYAGTLGKMEMVYDNQPYTILRDISATATFSEQTVSERVGVNNVLGYNIDSLKEIKLNNVLLTGKILDLIYQENEDKLFSKQENYTSDENGIIYLNTTDTIYQVFVYDSDGNLEQAYGTYEDTTITVNNTESDYSIYYSYIGEESYLLDKPENQYIKLDLIIVGNEDDSTQDMCLHVDKAIIRVDKNIYFNNTTNTVDLTIVVISTGLDYLTIK